MSIREQCRRTRLRQTGWIPSDARVRHYDELSDDTQATVAALANGSWTAPESAELDDGDVVKFTDYYEVRTR